jgi:hypothetical protein
VLSPPISQGDDIFETQTCIASKFLSLHTYSVVVCTMNMNEAWLVGKCLRVGLQATAIVITPEADWSARSPKLSPDGTKLVYVVSADSAAHMSCSRLCLADWPASPPTGVLASSTIVDVVGQPESDDAFPGMFLASEQLPRRCASPSVYCRRRSMHSCTCSCLSSTLERHLVFKTNQMTQTRNLRLSLSLSLSLSVSLYPRRVWLGDSRHVVLHSDWRMQRELVVVDTAGQKGSNVRRIETGDAIKKVRLYILLL